MTGKELQEVIIETAKLFGWRVAHFPAISTTRGGKQFWLTPVAADGKGFPDLLLVRDRLIVVEVKGRGDRMKPEQREWRTAFLLAKVPHYIWNEKAFLSGEVRRVLMARSSEPFDFAGATNAA